MLSLIEFLKAIMFGIVEGLTEWLPISSTGHLILFDSFIRLEQSAAFKEMFFVVIQLGAILAVVILYWTKLNPVTIRSKILFDRDILLLWSKILISCIPAAIIGLLFNDEIDTYFFNYQTVSITLVLYGVLFIIIESRKRKKSFRFENVSQITYPHALLIGVFQLLALIPGTSRSGATIIGAMLLGVSRTAAAEFTFFLAVPVMIGASLLKILKFGFAFNSAEMIVLITGMSVSLISSLLAIRFLTGYIKKHDFKVFGWYRIALGIAVIIVLA